MYNYEHNFFIIYGFCIRINVFPKIVFVPGDMDIFDLMIHLKC